MSRMITEAAEAEDLLSVHLTRVLPASRERVFAAWTSPDLMTRWWGPKGYQAISCTADPRPGGEFVIEIKSPEGEIHRMTGLYTEVEPPALVCLEIRHRLIEGAAEAPGGYIPTYVRVELQPHADGTELTLLHNGFLDAALAGRFNGGWSSSFDKLESTLIEQEK